MEIRTILMGGGWDFLKFNVGDEFYLWKKLKINF